MEFPAAKLWNIFLTLDKASTVEKDDNKTAEWQNVDQSKIKWNTKDAQLLLDHAANETPHSCPEYVHYRNGLLNFFSVKYYCRPV